MSSCNAKRAPVTAVHLVERVPEVPREADVLSMVGMGRHARLLHTCWDPHLSAHPVST